jgi:hypothetical protein
VTESQGKNYCFQRKCNNCVVKVHKGRDCWNKEESKDIDPANWKKREMGKWQYKLSKKKSR